MRQLFLGGGGRYHAGGYGRIAELCAEYVEAHGGTFLTRTRVERILVEDGRAVGVATADAEYRAPVVVSNSGLQPTILKLLGEGDVPETYAKEVEALEPGLGMVGVRYFLGERVLETGMIVAFSDQSWWDTERYESFLQDEWPDVPLVFAAVITEYDPSLAPDGHQIILLGFLGSADPKSERNEEAIARGEAAVAAMWPGIPEHIVKREVYTAASVSNLTRDAVVPGQGGECIGLSQVIGQCGRSKPDARTPAGPLHRRHRRRRLGLRYPPGRRVGHERREDGAGRAGRDRDGLSAPGAWAPGNRPDGPAPTEPATRGGWAMHEGIGR